MKHLLTMEQLSEKEILSILELADQLKYERKHHIEHPLLKGKSIFATFNAYRKQIEHERSESGYIQRRNNDLYHRFCHLI